MRSGWSRGSGSSPILSGDQDPKRLCTSQPPKGANPSTSRRAPPWHPAFTGPYRLPESEYHPSELQPPWRRRPASDDTSDSESSPKSARTKRKLTKSHPPHKRQTDPDMSSASSQEELGSDSSTHSSPLREPEIPRVPIWRDSNGKFVYGFTDDEAALDKYHLDLRKYEDKLARQEQLLTLKGPSKVPTVNVNECYSHKHKETILNAAKSILSLSAYLDGKEINRCTGIVIDRDEAKKSVTILTSAWIICTEKPFNDWLDKEYAPQAKVIVHLLDGTTVDSELIYFSKHYDVAFFEITGGLQLQSLPLEANLEFGQEAFVLARDTNLDLICRQAKMESVDPCEFQHNHYQFITGSVPNTCGTGGGLLDSNGKIVGMLFSTLPLVAFIPSSLILKCSTLLRKFGKIVRPQLGLKLRTIDFLGMSRIEKLSRNFNISAGLIVGEVSAKCVAEKLGVRVGDVILSCQGESVSNIAQFEDILVGVGEKHLEKSDLTRKVHVQVGVFHVRKCTRKLISLKVKLSDGIEVFRSGYSGNH